MNWKTLSKKTVQILRIFYHKTLIKFKEKYKSNKRKPNKL